MSHRKIIALIVAPSGAGKTAVCDMLSQKYGLKQVCSYTTRPPRYRGEASHLFIDESEVPNRDKMCAYTFYNGHHYFATHQQVDNADLYVIDPAGVQYFMKHYRGDRIPLVIKLDVPMMERMKRMADRGDTEAQIIKRIECDKRSFRFVPHDAKFANHDIEECADEIYRYISEQEKKLAELEERVIS